MRRWVVVALCALGGLTVALAASLALVGSQLDEAKIGRQDLQFEVDDLQQELSSVTEEKSALSTQLEDQRKASEQLKAELERQRAQQPQAQDAAAPATARSDSSATTPAGSSQAQ